MEDFTTERLPAEEKPKVSPAAVTLWGGRKRERKREKEGERERLRVCLGARCVPPAFRKWTGACVVAAAACVPERLCSH